MLRILFEPLALIYDMGEIPADLENWNPPPPRPIAFPQIILAPYFLKVLGAKSQHRHWGMLVYRSGGEPIECHLPHFKDDAAYSQSTSINTEVNYIGGIVRKFVVALSACPGTLFPSSPVKYLESLHDPCENRDCAACGALFLRSAMAIVAPPQQPLQSSLAQDNMTWRLMFRIYVRSHCGIAPLHMHEILGQLLPSPMYGLTSSDLKLRAYRLSNDFGVKLEQVAVLQQAFPGGAAAFGNSGDVHLRLARSLEALERELQILHQRLGDISRAPASYIRLDGTFSPMPAVSPDPIHVTSLRPEFSPDAEDFGGNT